MILSRANGFEFFFDMLIKIKGNQPKKDILVTLFKFLYHTKLLIQDKLIL